MIMVDECKSLEQFFVQDGMKSKKFWNYLFSKNTKKQR